MDAELAESSADSVAESAADIFFFDFFSSTILTPTVSFFGDDSWSLPDFFKLRHREEVRGDDHHIC